MTPRQRLAGTPYALLAANAARADAAATATSAGSATTAGTATTAASAPWSGLTGVPSGFSDGIDNDTLYGAGAGLLLLAGPAFGVDFAGTGSATTASRSDQTHSGSAIVSGVISAGVIDAAIARDSEVFGLVKTAAGPGSKLDADTVDGLEGSDLWQLSGNGGTAGRDFLGTTDNAPLELRVNSARALRLESNATSPNLLGGYRGNFVSAGAAGATIAGGGTANDGGGGSGVRTNRITASYGSIGGGFGNAVDATGGTIGGGRNNTITSTATNATIPGGMGASAVNPGQLTYAGGSFTTAGDAQTSTYVLRGTTSTSAPTIDLALDGASAAMTVPVEGRWAFDVLVVASMTGTTTAAYQLRGAIRNVAGTTALLPGAPALQTLGADAGTSSWSVTALADNTNDALVIRVTGSTFSVVRWVASVRVVELVF